MAHSYHEVMTKALTAAAQKLHALEGGADVIRTGTAFGDANNDTEIRADRVLGELIRDTILAMRTSGRITVEGLDEVKFGESGSGARHDWSGGLPDWWTVDPLDGSLDYKVRTPYWGGLPYTACITVLSDREPTFNSIWYAAFADLRSAPRLEMLFAEFCPDWDQGFHDHFTTHEPGGEKMKTHPATKLDLGSQIVLGDMYYPENRELLARMFAGKKGWLRNPGSAAYEMTLVATGQAVAYICDRQKQHELGAGYLLVKGAGGVAVDFDGKDLGTRKYDFKTQTPVVLAANQAIADQVLELMAKAK